MQEFDFRPQISPEPRPVQTRRSFPWATLIVGVVLVTLTLSAPSVIERLQHSRVRAEVAIARETLGDQKFGDFQSVAKAVGPSVVHINTRRAVARVAPVNQSDPRTRRYVARGQGSGVIVDAEGYIITNYHVVKGASDITVRLHDGRTRSATVVGTDAPSDLAVIKINTGGLIAAEWGDSESLSPGAFVLAVGSPFGLDHSITFGILSAKGRDHIGENRFQSFLQTDAAVNPGNSGGPLVNTRGQVIGINTAIYGETYQGISFAIPSVIAQDVYQQIREKGRVDRGWLGVAISQITEEMASELGLEATDGVQVTRLVQDSPADKAGIQLGDVILTWNDTKIDRPVVLSRQVADTEIGSQAAVAIIRDGQPMTLEVAVGRLPDELR